MLVNSLTNVSSQPPLLPFEEAHKPRLIANGLNGKALFDFGEATGVGLHTTFAGNTQPYWTIFTVLNMRSYGTYGTGYLEIQQGDPVHQNFPWYRQAPSGMQEVQGNVTDVFSTLNTWALVCSYVVNGQAAARVNRTDPATGGAPMPIPSGLLNINPGKMGYFGRQNYEFDFRGQLALQWGYAG